MKSRRLTLNVALTALTVIVALMTVTAAYGGYVNPYRSVIPALLAMCFPALIALTAVAAVALLLLRRRAAAAIALTAVAASLPSVFTYSPVNFPRSPLPDEEGRSFTVMTFNGLEFFSYRGTPAKDEPNPSVQSIIDNNPDIVCLQECIPARESKKLGITKEQEDILNKRYPWRKSSHEMTLYSRYPVTRVILNDRPSRSSFIYFYRISIEGHLLTLCSVHLESIGLDDKDKALYLTLTKGDIDRSNLKRARGELASKLGAAFRKRAAQARLLCEVTDSIGGDIVLCGDFNDIPGCYTDRLLVKHGFKDAYAAAGAGPGISYRANRFWFRIDHVFWRGNLRAISCRRLKEGISDHYPVLTTFVWE